MINQANLTDALHLWRTKPDVWSELKTDFPEQLADLTSFESNPNCSCGGRLNKFFREKLSLDTNALKQNLLAGKIIEIEKGEQSWAEFVPTLMGKQFHSFSVVERENKVAVYFL
jgi:hypothetical protein